MASGAPGPWGKEGGCQGTIRRRFSHQMTAPVGKLLRGEVRPAADRAEEWEPFSPQKHALRTPWLRQALAGTGGVLTRCADGKRWLAVPWDPSRPFPLVPIVCCAVLRRIRDRDYAVFVLDGEEWPQFP